MPPSSSQKRWNRFSSNRLLNREWVFQMTNDPTFFETNTRTAIKTFSWRITATLATVTLVYLFTGELGIAAAIGGVEVVLKLVLYYAHERVWNQISFGRCRGASSQNSLPQGSSEAEQNGLSPHPTSEYQSEKPYQEPQDAASRGLPPQPGQQAARQLQVDQ